MSNVTLIDESGRAREHDTGTFTHPPIVLIVAGVEYVRVSNRRGQLVYREMVDASDNEDTR